MQVEVQVPGRPALLIDDGILASYREQLGDAQPKSTRLAYAATRIVLQDNYAGVAHSVERPGAAAEIAEAVDWDATSDLRRRLDTLGFGVAEAMDTAQRFEVGWQTAERLILNCGKLGLANGFVAGAGVDHLPVIESPADLVEGVVHQARVIQEAGGDVILLPLQWLAQSGCDAETYVAVYSQIIERLDGPLFVHWLGEMFQPQLAGYFPEDSFQRVMDSAPEKVRGAKLSLLDADREVRLRRVLLANDQVLLTGDDLHFAELILGGDAQGSSQVAPVERWVPVGTRTAALGDFSHALLGVLDAVAEPASLALSFLDRGDRETYLTLMRPCEDLGRCLFQAPTRHYKAGLAFLAWLNGLQPNPMLANHEERARDRDHYLRAAELACAAGALRDAGLAADRLEEFIAADAGP